MNSKIRARMCRKSGEERKGFLTLKVKRKHKERKVIVGGVQW